ncbi:MAG: hypothetical protein Q9227_001540 [Pyrenula ochraceoflavens]
MVGVRNAISEEGAEVEVLNANLEKLKTLTKKIQGSISRLDESGQVVKQAIGPIYSNTQTLQVTNNNVDRINEAIERLRQPLDAKGREEGIIRAGPRSAGLNQYFAALKRVDRALTDLSSSNLRSNQQAISEFNSLLTSGSAQLQDLFRATLKEDVRPIEPLHYITKQLAFPTLGQEKLSRLAQMASAINSAAGHAAKFGQSKDPDPAVRIYAEVRGPYLSSSLQNLASASISTSKRKAQDSGIYREGTSGIGAYASGLEGMSLAEYDNISSIFSSNQRTQVVEITAQDAYGQFARTLSELNGFIKSNIMADCFLAFEIIDIVTPLSYRLESRTGGLKATCQDALRPVRDTAKGSLNELLEETRRKSSTVAVLPNDGAPVPIVQETMSRMNSLAIFAQPLSSILTSIGDGNWRSPASNTSIPPIDVGADGSTLLSHYLLDTIDTLFSALENRARTFHRTKPLQGCFLANVMAVIDRQIRLSPELSRYLGSSSGPQTQKLDAWRKKGSSLYLDAWRDPSSHLFDVQYTNRTPNPANRPTSGSSVDSAAIVKALSSKDKDKIKEKFKAFNLSFDELVARHKSLYMEREVRNSLSREVQAMIEPLYARFWDRYHEIDKGKGKTVKYDKGGLAAVLAGLS